MATKPERRAPRSVEHEPAPQPLMVVCGPERALVDAAVQHIRRTVLVGGMAVFNHDRLRARQHSLEQILACARTLPVMAKQRLVEVSDGEDLGAEALEKLAEYGTKPSPEAVVLVVASDIDGRTRAAKALTEQGALYRYDHLSERELEGYARRRAKAMGLELDDEAAELIVMAVGTELQLLERALEKLQLAAPAGRVTAELVEEQVSQTRVESVFALTDAIASGNPGDALTVLGQMLDAREAPLRILATLAWQQRQLIRARDLVDQGMPGPDVLRAVKVFKLGDRFLRQVRAMSVERVTAGLLAIERADRLLKSSRARPRAIMEQTLLALTRVG